MSTVTSPWWRAFRPAESREPGFVTLPSGRKAFDTGKVLIGIQHQAVQRDHGPHADALQASLLEHRLHALDAHHRPSLRARLCDALCWLAVAVGFGGFFAWLFVLGAPRPW